MTNTTTIELDIVNESEALDVILPRMTEGYDGITYSVVTLDGPGGGWPLVRFTGPRNSIQAMLDNEYVGDPIETYEVR